MQKNNESFSYTYSAKEQAELEKIRKKYLPQEEDKMEQLRQLDRMPNQKAQALSLTVGIIGALIMGAGMSLCMTDLGDSLGHMAMAVGVVIGLAGMALAILAYPLYNRVLTKERQRIAPQVLQLTEELMK